ncbi:MAG: HTTM domain-containing protein [Labilithrix sp.]|nr:HTTM domain-containing protein [Labilithrix sp.]MCW5812063.1 HTTM domain-containing protein [Labilithrix sp.]
MYLDVEEWVDVNRQVIRAVATLDLRSLAAMRIGIGALMLADVLERSSRLTLDYTDEGLLPRSWLIEAGRDAPLLFVHGVDGGAPFAAACMIASAVVAALLLAGWRTRMMSLLAWILWSSLQARNPMIAHHGDTILRFILFWGALLPWGARWSLDARRRPPAPDAFVGPAAVGYLLQLVFVYAFSVAYKTGPAWREDFDAVALALRVHGYATPLGEALLGYPRAIVALTISVLALEALGAFLVLSPWRTEAARLVAAAAFITFHVGLGLTMRLGLFVPLAIVAWIGVLPARVWRRGPPTIGESVGGRAATWITAAATAFALLVNVDALASFRARTDVASPLPALPVVAKIAARMGLSQEWSMFAPEPASLSGRLRATMTRADGETVDVLRGEVVEPNGPLPDGPRAPLRVRQQELRWAYWMYPEAVERYARYACANGVFGEPPPPPGLLTVRAGLASTREVDRTTPPEWIELVSVPCDPAR